MLNTIYMSLGMKYATDNELITKLWSDLEQRYSEAHRYYHTLNHLENLEKEINSVKEQVADWDCIMFALFYHDAIYNPKAGDNEEQSAALAEQHLKLLGFPKHEMEKCTQHIQATKGHSVSDNNDTNLFTDADLSILGKGWNTYEQYCKAIRAEYAHVPDAMFSMGRKGVLQHFLKMPRIFKTDRFYELYEMQARNNMEQEISLL